MDADLPTAFSAKLEFSQITERMERIEKAKSSNDKVNLFRKFVEKIKELQVKFKNEVGDRDPTADVSSFPVLRLFIPGLDTERDSYGIKTKTLGNLFVKALAINSNSEDGKKLTLKTVTGDDYGTVVYNVMKDRSPQRSTLMVYEVDHYLELIANHFKDNQRSKIEMEMVRMLNGLCAMDRKWLTRIILKKLNLGLGQKTMLKMYHKDAESFYNQYSYLSNVIKTIESGRPIDEQFSIIELFKPVRPMLCERCPIKKINQMLCQHEYYLETKMDGERFHIHVKGNEFKYFSRSCNDDFTPNFGSDSSGGRYSPLLYRVLNGRIRNAILDGEMMVWKNDNFTRKAAHSTARILTDPESNVCFVIYDIIYLNDVCLTKIPYAERQRLMRSTFEEQRGVFMFCQRDKVRDASHFLECLNKAFDANEEGVVIKQGDSIYQPGKRDNGGWLKIKPDYANNLITDFDLLIIGANYNEFKEIVSFLMGVFDKDKNSDGDSGTFHAVCRVRNGFTDVQFDELRGKLAPFWKEVKSSKDRRLVNGISCIQWNRAQPDVWIEPCKSIVLQIKGSELSETNTFSTSHTIRFARVTSIRCDKNWYDTCTLNEFQTFCSSGSKVEKLTKRNASETDIVDDDSRAPTLSKRKKIEPVQQFKYSRHGFDEIEIVDEVCKGLEFCILSCEKKLNTIEEMKNIVRRHCGTITENPGRNTFICIAGDENQRVKDKIKSAKYNIVKSKWLVSALGDNQPKARLPRFSPKDFLYKTIAMTEQLRSHYDRYDDSYIELFKSVDDLKKFLDGMKIDDIILTSKELHQIETELSEDGQVENIFRLHTAFFYDTNAVEIGNDVEVAKFIFKTKAGNCLQNAEEVEASKTRLTHIFVRDSNFDKKELKQIVKSFESEYYSDIVVLRLQWIMDCYQTNRLIDEKVYRVYVNWY